MQWKTFLVRVSNVVGVGFLVCSLVVFIRLIWVGPYTISSLASHTFMIGLGVGLGWLLTVEVVGKLGTD